MSPRNRLALAPGFNPLFLPDVAPPVPGARPWQWLAEPGADHAEVQEYLERFVAGFGTVDPTDLDLEVRPLPREQVIVSHLDQDVVFNVLGAPAVTVRLSAVAPDEASGAFPFTGAVAIVGTIPPSSRAVQALGRSLRKELQAHLDSNGIGHWRAVAVDRGRRWLENALIVDYTDGEEVRFAARMYLQPFLTVWRSENGRSVLDVVELDRWPDEHVVATGYASLGRVEHRPCPLIPGAGRADLCQMHGGPWISRSITAAARWEGKRSRMVTALGCDTCGDGSIKVFCGRPLRIVQGTRSTHDLRIDDGTQSRHDELVGSQGQG